MFNLSTHYIDKQTKETIVGFKKYMMPRDPKYLFTQSHFGVNYLLMKKFPFVVFLISLLSGQNN